MLRDDTIPVIRHTDATAAHYTPRRAHSGRAFADAAAVTRGLRPDTPVFCFSAGELKRVVSEFRQGFPGTVTYAVKANPTPEIIATMTECGIDGFDVASPREMEIVRSHDPTTTLHYHNPVKSRTEIETAWTQHGVLDFAIDDLDGFDRISTIVGASPEVEIAVRFRLPVSRAVHDFSTKFGADVSSAAELLARVAERGYRPSLTFHPGSQCLDPAGYAEHIAAAGEIVRRAGVTLSSLNVGGGFPVAYPGSTVPALGSFFEAIAASTASTFEEMPTLVSEPGRALVSTCTSVLARVKHVKRDSCELYLNDGIYGAFAELTQYPARLPVAVIADGHDDLGCDITDFVVFGPTCDPVDRLPEPVTLPHRIREGDWIEFGMVGAYGAATVTRFNGYGTDKTIAVASVHGGQAH